MKPKKPSRQNGPFILNDRPLQLLVVVVLFAVLANFIFFLTYPINIGQSDNPTYLRMISLGTSHLLQASGYPAILYFLSHRILPAFSRPLSVANEINNHYFNVLQSVQVLLHLTLFFLSIFLGAKVFGKSAAAILALGWGCNVLFISNVNATAPEWLQGHALILSVLLHGYARKRSGIKGKKPESKRKLVSYSLGAAAFGVAYVIKPNSLLFAVALLGFVVFEKESRRFKALQLLCSVIMFLFVVLAFAHSYHYRSTGTTQLTFDHAWVLTASLPPDYIFASPDRLGVNSLRWAALARVTPADYFRAGFLVENINYGPSTDIRQRYQKQLEHISSLSREELVQFMKENPLPSDYSQWLSAVPLYYYYGLEKTDALGTAVFIESLRSHWRHHLGKIAGAFPIFVWNGLKTIQTFPTPSDPIGFEFLPPDFKTNVFGTSRIVAPRGKDPYALQYYNPRETVSYYGARVVEILNTFTSASILYVTIHIVALLGLFKLTSDLDKITVFSLLLSFVFYISASGILFGLRQKELIAITPIYFLTVSIGLLNAIQWWTQRNRLKPGHARHAGALPQKCEL